MKKYQEFFNIAQDRLTQTLENQGVSIEKAARAMANSLKAKGIIHVFGCGHSQMFAQELFYRAGGLAGVNAILPAHLSVSAGARLSTFQERLEGFAGEILKTQYTTPNDIMIVASISGRNAVPVDMALAAKEKGMTVIAVTSLIFSKAVTSRHSSGKKLPEVADIVLDVNCDEGDAVLSHPGLESKFCGMSTVISITMLQACVAQTIENLLDEGITPDVWVSSNLEHGDEINRKHMEKYMNIIQSL